MLISAACYLCVSSSGTKSSMILVQLGGNRAQPSGVVLLRWGLSSLPCLLSRGLRCSLTELENGSCVLASLYTWMSLCVHPLVKISRLDLSTYVLLTKFASVGVTLVCRAVPSNEGCGEEASALLVPLEPRLVHLSP